MAEMDPHLVRRLSPPLLLGLPLFVYALDFALLTITYLALTPLTPDLLGDVATTPAKFAAWIALVKLPMTLAHMLALSWRGWSAALTRGEVSDPPVRTARRRTLARVRDWAADATWSALAALLVFDLIADPGDAHLWQLVAVTALGPLLLPKAASGAVWLLRRWWRRRRPPTPEYEAAQRDAR